MVQVLTMNYIATCCIPDRCELVRTATSRAVSHRDASRLPRTFRSEAVQLYDLDV